jgi:hypothetical protein
VESLRRPDGGLRRFVNRGDAVGHARTNWQMARCLATPFSLDAGPLVFALLPQLAPAVSGEGRGEGERGEGRGNGEGSDDGDGPGFEERDWGMVLLPRTVPVNAP